MTAVVLCTHIFVLKYIYCSSHQARDLNANHSAEYLPLYYYKNAKYATYLSIIICCDGFRIFLKG